METSHSIDTSSSIETSSFSAIIYIYRAVDSCPSIDANTRKTSNTIYTSSSVLTYRWSRQTLVHILFAVLSRISGRAFACIRIYAIQTCGSILALVSGTIVDIFFTVKSSKTCSKAKYK